MKYLIALLTAATGLLHLLVGFNVIGPGAGGTNWMLVLNGVGYLVLLVLFWKASGNGGTIRWILLAYTLITFLGYFFLNSAANYGLGNSIGLITKAIELLLILLLFLYRGSGQPAAKPTPAPATRAPAGFDATRTGKPSIDTTISGTAAKASAGVAAAGAGVVAAAESVADRAATTVDSAIDETGEAAGKVAAAAVAGADYVGEKAEAAYDAAADAAGETAEAVGDVVDETAGAAEDAAAWAGDKAGDAYDAVADVVTDAGDAVADVAADAGDAVADVVADAGDAVSAAVRGGEAAVAGVVAEVAGKGEDSDKAEPDVEGSIEEIAEYLRSFGRSSEFTKEIEYVEGIGAVYGQKLRGAGVSTITDLLLNGYTRRGRKHISDQTGIAQSLILTWVNHVDLYRIKGVAQEYADLLEQSGVDTVMELAQRNPANLHKRMLEVNEQKSLVRRAPHASEVQSWVEQAKSLRRLIYY